MSTILVTQLENLILDLFMRFSVAIYIKGRRGTGKTDFALLIAEILNRFNFIKMFATNIEVHEAPFQVDYITNLEDLDDWARSKTDRKLFIGDEWGKAMKRRRPMSELSIELMDKLQTLRKYRLSAIFIAPADKYIDSSALGSDVLDVIVEKPIFNTPQFALWDDQLTYFQTQLHNIPRTNVKFATYDIAPFVLHRAKRIPTFNDKDLEALWKWSNGSTAKDVGLYRSQLHNKLKNFVKRTLESNVQRTT